MNKLDLIIFIKHSGPNVRYDNMKDTVSSLIKTNEGVNYGFYVVADDHLVAHVKKIFGETDPTKLLECIPSRAPWHRDFNHFFESYKEKAEWILISHDDIEYCTPNFFKKITTQLQGFEDKVGWVIGTDKRYLYDHGLVVPEGLRPDLYQDQNQWGAMFHLHKMAHLKGGSPLKVKDSLHLIDLPSAPVKIGGIMSCMMLVQSSALEKIGPCAEWTNYTMLIDADWSLEALKNNLWNVWVPDVYYRHPLRKDLRPTGHKWQRKAHDSFAQKWGFDLGARPLPIKKIRKKYKDTNIFWLTYKNSYDWEYLNED
jgi:hypothetical protein